ncbi:MAG: biosynthetic peptidoglycan transglycosylase [Lutibacter sp.]
MIKIINYFFGFIIFIIAFVTIRLSNQFRSKYKFIEISINQCLLNNNQISKQLINSVIIIEDIRFFTHFGVDFYSIVRSIRNFYIKGRLEGASTIPQQLLRTISNDRELSLKRKIIEILISTLISKKFTKNEILMAYFETYNFNNCIGISNLCKIELYDLNNLTDYENTQLAARFKHPSINKRNYLKYLKRVRIIEIRN